jgi:UPF0716 family protein affecting phage T7 exclusion
VRRSYWILILITATVVIGLFMSRDPERAERISQMYRDAALTGETRQMVLMGLAIVIGGFIVYLTVTRR